MSLSNKPAYFDRIADDARETCEILAAKPDIAGAWNLLFEQIQNPGFVISELLQNADDAGATQAEVSLDDREFVFSHNGQDFNEDQFGSLCRFGFSNKRTIHTIGFRGIGFKSTFSLGRTVEVWSPTLGVAFSDGRFIEPRWIHDGRTVGDTRIKIRIDRAGAYDDVRSSLEKWRQSPASLLFFNNIRKLTLNGQVIECTELSTDIPNTLAVNLAGETSQSLFLLRSEEEPFPPEVIAEIAQTRKVSDLNLGSCKVEVVLGIPGAQHLFVVLPTGEPLALPFSVNAPFLLKPDRFDIKSPSTSPTNAWLLARAGRLVADVVHAWVINESLPFSRRVEAYRFLPDPQLTGSVGSIAIRDSLIKGLSAREVVLNSDEETCAEAAAVPSELFDIWSDDQIRTLFCPDSQLLHPGISSGVRQTLEKLGWIRHIPAETILDQMKGISALPRPETDGRLALLWEFVFEHQPRFDNYYDHSLKRVVPIVPVDGKDQLLPSSSVVRVSTRTETLSAETVAWLSERTAVLDLGWVDSITKFDESRRHTLGSLLHALQLHEPTPANRLVEQAAASVFARTEVAIDECVHLAQLLAALEAKTPAGFHFVTYDNYRRTIDHGLVFDPTGEISDLVPEAWSDAHILHSDYEKYVHCADSDWRRWVSSSDSGLHVGIPVTPKPESIYSRSSLRKLLAERNSAEPSFYPYSRDNFTIEDHVLAPELIAHWASVSAQNPEVWRRVLRLILMALPHEWKDSLTASAYQRGNDKRKPLSCPPITSQWVAFFRDKPCLADTDLQIGIPSELYRRTPDTEALQGSREFRFVEAELDTEAIRPVLRQLGTLDSPADFKKIVSRLDALRTGPVSDSVIATVSTLYQVLDRIVARCRPVDRAELEGVFAREQLVMAADRTWQTSGELSVFPGDVESPEPGTHVHPAFQSLSMWERIGVPLHPSVTRVLDWLRSLTSGQLLDGATGRRVRRALARDALGIWEECGHWLSLDNTWEPVSRFAYRHTLDGVGAIGQLEPRIKRRVADLRPVATTVRTQAPFADLPELNDALESRVTRFTPVTGRFSPPTGLLLLAGSFCSLILADSGKQARVRAIAGRLSRSRWQVASELEVTPYLDQTPAGIASSVKVAWSSDDFYVLGAYSGRLHRPLVEELARAFDAAEVSRAFDSCIGRDEGFILDYLAEYFTFDAAGTLPFAEVTAAEVTSTPVTEDSRQATTSPEEDSQSLVSYPGEIDVDEIEDAAPDDSISVESTEPARALKPRHVPDPSPFERYAGGLGFKVEGNAYIHSGDGRKIVKGEAPFHWHLLDGRGGCLKRYWTSRDHLESGVDVPAEVWSLTLQAPTEVIWVMASGDAGFRAITGQELNTQISESRLRLYTSGYRLRQEEAV